MYIETERLIIDDIRPEDRDNYFTNISHDKEVLKTFVCQYQEELETFDFNKYIGRTDIFALREKPAKNLIGIFVIGVSIVINKKSRQESPSGFLVCFFVS